MSRKNRSSSQNQNKQTKAYVPVYSQTNYNNDEEQFDKSVKEGKINWGSFQRLMLINHF